MGVLSSAVDRLLHTTARRTVRQPAPAAARLHRSAPVVDLVVGTALFRPSLLASGGRGHVDLARLEAGGVNVVGLTLATRFPNLRGTLSGPHFRSLGMPARALQTNMATLEWLIDRIEEWSAASGGRLRLLRSRADLDEALRPAGPVGIFLGVQGAHALDGKLANLERLRARGVRMLAPAHVMDNAFVGSGTGRRRGGLSGPGRELIAELERQRIIVDLAHMSPAGIEQSLERVTRPPALSHAGLLRTNERASHWRRYSPATRNVPDWAVRGVGQANGVVGLVLSSELLGGDSIGRAAAAFDAALELAGESGVAIGSDMDGGLRMIVDSAGLPLLTDGLLSAGLPAATVRAVLGGNALRLLADTFERPERR
jgi:membrane dipeptidase